MADEPFGRQLQPVSIQITGGEKIDREHWAGRIKGMLEHIHPCVTNSLQFSTSSVFFTIYPDANND